MTRRYYITPTAARNIHNVAADSEQKWGTIQTAKYLTELRDSFTVIAENYSRFSDKADMTRKTELSLHRVNKHYVVFKPLDINTIAIIAVLHERMDIPARLKELQSKTKAEIAAIRAAIHIK